MSGKTSLYAVIVHTIIFALALYFIEYIPIIGSLEGFQGARPAPASTMQQASGAQQAPSMQQAPVGNRPSPASSSSMQQAPVGQQAPTGNRPTPAASSTMQFAPAMQQPPTGNRSAAPSAR